MSAMQETIRAHGSAAAGRLRIMLVVAALAVGLVAGFGLGRVADRGSPTVVPVWPMPTSVSGYSGPGHVPRHWIEQLRGDCSPLESRPFRCLEPSWGSVG